MHSCKVYLIYFQKWHRYFMGTIFTRDHESTSWEVQWLFTSRWKTRGFEGAPVDSWLFFENAVSFFLYQQKGLIICYMIPAEFYVQFAIDKLIFIDFCLIMNYTKTVFYEYFTPVFSQYALLKWKFRILETKSVLIHHIDLLHNTHG